MVSTASEINEKSPLMSFWLSDEYDNGVIPVAVSVMVPVPPCRLQLRCLERVLRCFERVLRCFERVRLPGFLMRAKMR